MARGNAVGAVDASGGGSRPVHWDSIRRLFPITRRYSYLNHCAIGPTSDPVVSAVSRFEHARQRLGSLGYPQWEEDIARVRTTVANFIGARPTEIAFTKNTPEGISLVASGIRWRDGDKVVTSSVEYHANVRPWLNLKDRGVKVEFVAPDQAGRIPAERLLEAIDDRTRVVGISWVQFHNGYRADLKLLGTECRQRGVRLVVDAIQGVGALALDVRDSKVDYLAFSGHKWMLGPLGVGVLYVRDELLDELSLSEIGQRSVERGESLIDYSLPLKQSAERFESGILPTGLLLGLEAAIGVHALVGAPTVEDRIFVLADRLIDGATSAGYEHLGPAGRSERSGIVTIRGRKLSSEEVVQRLLDAQVVASVREGAIRFGVHICNVESDVDKAIDVLRHIARR
jgi:cysteine desulfurase/selenocysteine lyase